MMLQNLMEDYVLHMQQQLIGLGVLMQAVPSKMQSLYAHNGMFDYNANYQAYVKGKHYFEESTWNNNIVSILDEMSKGVTIDVEYFSACQRSHDFINHDGDMYEIIPSSNPDSPPEEHDNDSDVKQDITRKRKALLADSVMEFTTDRIWCEGCALYFENSLSVNMCEIASSQLLKVEDLCCSFTCKAVQDPFVLALGSATRNDKYILRKELVIFPVQNVCNGPSPMCTYKRQQVEPPKISFEETFVACDTEAKLNTLYGERLANMDKMETEDPQKDYEQTKDPCLSELQSVADKLSSHLTLYVESLEILPCREPTFMRLNTEGLKEFEDGTFVMESPSTDWSKSILLLTEHGDSQSVSLTKLKLPRTENVLTLGLNYMYSEEKVLQSEMKFIQTVSCQLQVPNLREATCYSSAVVSSAIHALHPNLQGTHNELDLTLSWDPVSKSTGDVHNKNESMEQFSYISEKQYIYTEEYHKFIPDSSLYDELRSCNQVHVHVSPTYKEDLTNICMNALADAENSTSNNVKETNNGLINDKNIPRQLINDMKDGHLLGNSLEDFFHLRMGLCDAPNMQQCLKSE